MHLSVAATAQAQKQNRKDPGSAGSTLLYLAIAPTSSANLGESFHLCASISSFLKWG